MRLPLSTPPLRAFLAVRLARPDVQTIDQQPAGVRGLEPIRLAGRRV